MRNLQPKDKNVRLVYCNIGETSTQVGYSGYGRVMHMTHYKKERGWYVDGVGPLKKTFAIEQCAALCKSGTRP